MSEDRKRGVDIGGGYAFIQWSDEVTGRKPFSGFTGFRGWWRRWRIRVTEENIQGMVRYMIRRLTGRGPYVYGGVLPARTDAGDRIPARLSPGGRLMYPYGDHSGPRERP